MGSRIKICIQCRQYTLEDKCSLCAAKTGNPLPPKFSPLDPYGKYRRIAKKGDLCKRIE